MKKRTVRTGTALLLALLLTACSSTLDFDIGQAARIELRSGTTGELVEITQEDTIRQITDNINALRFSRGASSSNTDGWGYALWWYDDQGVELESVVVMSETTISYDDYFYTSSEGGGINTTLLDDLLAGAE